MRHHPIPHAALLHATLIAAGIALGTATTATADNVLTTTPVPHCRWGDIGCTNPPPVIATESASPQGTVHPAVIGDLTLGLADLVIDQVQPSPAVPTKLFVKVTNKGNVASTPTNLKAIRWTGGQATARGTLVPAIQPGQSQVVLAELGGTIAGATQLYVRVDDPNRIKEQDETNNSFKVK